MTPASTKCSGECTLVFNCNYDYDQIVVSLIRARCEAYEQAHSHACESHLTNQDDLNPGKTTRLSLSCLPGWQSTENKPSGWGCFHLLVSWSQRHAEPQAHFRNLKSKQWNVSCLPTHVFFLQDLVWLVLSHKKFTSRKKKKKNRFESLKLNLIP